VQEILTRGQVAKRSGVATSALRFYEERRLTRSESNASGHRRNPQAVIRRVAFIVFAKKIGLTLEEVRQELAKLPQNGVPESSELGQALRRVDPPHRPAHHGTPAPASGPHELHRLRLPFARPMSARQSLRPRRPPWPWRTIG
jgi:DNA-binding transcriptional MerR regulator